VFEPGTAGAVRIEGQVTDGKGDPVSDALIEIWQPDQQGHYRSAGGGSATGFGRARTDSEGVFSFLAIKPGATPAPDGRRQLAARVDNSPVQRWWIADPAHPERPPRAVRYPAAGTANADVTLHVLRLDGTRTEVTWDRDAYEYLTNADWDSRGPLLSVQSRDQRTVMVLAADADTVQTTLLHTERDDAWVELAPGAPARTSAGDLVTVSDRDGSRRLVVGGAAVTPDGLHVDSVS